MHGRERGGSHWAVTVALHYGRGRSFRVVARRQRPAVGKGEVCDVRWLSLGVGREGVTGGTASIVRQSDHACRSVCPPARHVTVDAATATHVVRGHRMVLTRAVT